MRKIYLRTFGCQMNVRDSEIVRGMLEGAGYVFVEDPSKSDIVIFNTCSVRAHAEHRALSIMGAISRIKPRRIFGLIGCVAQHRKEALFKSVPNLDFICGPSEIYKIPTILKKLITYPECRNNLRITSGSRRNSKEENFIRDNLKLKTKKVVCKNETRPLDYVNPKYRESDSHAYVNIMYGCNNFCSYCIVPYVRGREVSMPVEDILREIKELTDRGIRDITLLGQNVNSYREPRTENREPNFIDLLEKINNIDGIKKISFMTSHPKDASINLFKAMRDLEKINKHLHLPLQSGSNRILKLMNRGYSIEKYRNLIDAYRNLVPKGRLTTDIIVGFPTEAEEDFDKTKKAIEDLRFDSAYIFKYSPRPPAKSAEMRDDVNPADKKRRNNELLALQKKISKETKDEGRETKDEKQQMKSSVVSTAKAIIILFLEIALLFTSLSSFAIDRDEKKALEKIETLILKEDFETAKAKCDRFLVDYRRSRYRRRVEDLRDIASRKTAEFEPKTENREPKTEKDTYYIVQVGAFSKYRNASRLKGSLRRQGFDSVILKVRKGRRIFYKVRAGKFKYLENAEKLMTDLRRKGYSSEIINEK